MKTSDVNFLEAFKRLEALCNDRFSCQSGVSEYIAQMERMDAQGRASVPGWAADYKNLKHLRWVRNQLAHNPDVEGLSKPEELRQLQDFLSRIQAKKDPLILAAGAGKSKSAAAKPMQTQKTAQAKETQKSSHVGAAILLILLLLLVLSGLGVLYLDLSGTMTAKELLENAKNAISGLLQK